ncbi:MAG: transglutaminase-like domain-containing protein [Thermofilaceae archaeon]
MEEDGFTLATRVVDPFLTKYRSYLIGKYGADILDLKTWYLLRDDVYLYVQIEKLQVELAFGRISKKEFTDSLLALMKQQHDLPPEVVQIIRDLYKALAGQSSPALRSVEAIEKKPEAEVWFWRTYNEGRSRTKLSERGREGRTAEVTSIALKSHTLEKTVLSERKEFRKITILIALIIIPILFLIFLNLDFDGDGLTNWVEIKQGLNFLDADTDKDFLNDKYELRLGTNPLAKDTDGDGLSDWHEVVHGTSPSKVDTDNDGLTDYYEFLIGTNPLDADTDGDELLDEYELKIGTNPLEADTDSDGLLDGFELEIGTNPLSWDTDDDELSDKEELRRGTNPLLNDTDADGLVDGVEVRVGTHPLNSDTDRDGLLDGYELRIGTNPLRNWRVSFNEDTVKSTLSKFFRIGVSQLASTLRGKSPAETVWNVLKWLHENIRYDYEKARKEHNYSIYSPPETVKMGKGICADYSLLTAALLLESGLSEAYILLLSSSNSRGHAAAAVVVNGRTYVLDQSLPPLRYEEYESYFSKVHEPEVWHIELVYRVTLDREGEPSVKTVGPTQLPKGRGMTDAEISSAVYRALRRLNPRLEWDSVLIMALSPLAAYYLPYDYKEKVVYTLSLHPATLSVDFAEAWLSEMFRNHKDIIGKYSRIYVHVERPSSERTITVIIVLANL